MSDQPQRCPHDGGACHHTCARTCFRMRTGGQLTTPWPGFPRSGVAPIPGAIPETPPTPADYAAAGRECANGKCDQTKDDATTADMLADVPTWMDAHHLARDAFLLAMRRHHYGYDATLDAWAWFNLGWLSRLRGQETSR